MTGKYEDIINLERPVSQKYPHMSIASRAAQFAPYKTITIYHDQLDNTESQGNATFQENTIIPDSDYFEYDEIFDLPNFLDDYSNSELDNDISTDL